MTIIAIRAEDKNEWERRTALIPEHCRSLITSLPIKIVVQRSDLRVFQDNEYATNGCEIVDGIENADIIIGVKEIPPEKIRENKVYLFFSHTIKGQQENMPILKKILKLRSTLIDYEKIVDSQGRRLIFFGRFAGLAGSIDALWLIGRQMAHRRISTSLSSIRQSLAYEGLSQAKKEIGEIASKIAEEGFPKSIAPFVVGIFGYGNVSKGSQEIFSLFEHQRVTPEELVTLHNEQKLSSSLLYLVEFKEEHMVARKDGLPFDLNHYYNHPEEYYPLTAPYLPFLKLVINAIFWDERYPRFVTKEAVKRLWVQNAGSAYLTIADLSCDINGAVELTVKPTDPGKPSFVFNPMSGNFTDGYKDDGVLILAVDNLPCEFSRDASIVFSTALQDFIPHLVQADFSRSFESLALPTSLKKAVIAHHGSLTPDYEYLKKFLF